MIRLSILFFLLSSFIEVLNAQENIKYEQVAFEFFQKELFSVNDKSKVVLELLPFNDQLNWYSKCLKPYFNLDGTSISVNPSKEESIDPEMINGNLKVKPFGKRGFPAIHVYTSFGNISDLHIVNIEVVNKVNRRLQGDIYHLVIDRNSQIVFWCKGGWRE